MSDSEPTGRVFRDARLRSSTFEHVDLSGSSFTRVDLARTTFRSVDLDGADIRDASVKDVRLRGVDLVRVDIWGDVDDVRLNGIDVGALVSAELDRLHPERLRLHPTDAQGFREAWEVLGELWAGTVERARRLEARRPGLLHESVGDEWSFLQTLRHLAFATSSWLTRVVQQDPSPWHPLELPWDEMPPTQGVPRDRDAQPTLDEVLQLRSDRFERVRSHLASLTDADLASERTTPEGTGWPPAGETFAVKEPLDILLNEEWWHRQFAERDLTVLEAGLDSATGAETAQSKETS